MKLRIPSPDIIEKIKKDAALGVLMEDWREIRMRSVYYDTPDDDLFKRKWSLRLRHENNIPVITMKSLGAREGMLFSREEWQEQASSLEEGISILLKHGAPEELGRFSPLEARCEVIFIRSAVTMALKDGSVIEFAVDNGVMYAGGNEGACLELEMELLTGEPNYMLELAGKLENKYGLTRELESKYMRALSLIRNTEKR